MDLVAARALTGSDRVVFCKTPTSIGESILDTARASLSFAVNTLPAMDATAGTDGNASGAQAGSSYRKRTPRARWSKYARLGWLTQLPCASKKIHGRSENHAES